MHTHAYMHSVASVSGHVTIVKALEGAQDAIFDQLKASVRILCLFDPCTFDQHILISTWTCLRHVWCMMCVCMYACMYDVCLYMHR